MIRFEILSSVLKHPIKYIYIVWCGPCFVIYSWFLSVLYAALYSISFCLSVDALTEGGTLQRNFPPTFSLSHICVWVRLHVCVRTVDINTYKRPLLDIEHMIEITDHLPPTDRPTRAILGFWICIFFIFSTWRATYNFFLYNPYVKNILIKCGD